jgi:hypothetical protein
MSTTGAWNPARKTAISIAWQCPRRGAIARSAAARCQAEGGKSCWNTCFSQGHGPRGGFNNQVRALFGKTTIHIFVDICEGGSKTRDPRRSSLQPSC